MPLRKCVMSSPKCRASSSRLAFTPVNSTSFFAQSLSNCPQHDRQTLRPLQDTGSSPRSAVSPLAVYITRHYRTLPKPPYNPLIATPPLERPTLLLAFLENL